MKITKALEGFWLTKRIYLRPNTVRDYTLTLDRLVAYVGDVEVEVITTNNLRAFFGHLSEQFGLSKRTLVNVWAALASFWAWASEELKIPNIVRGKLERPRFSDNTPPPYTKEELAAMIRFSETTMPWRARNGKKVRSRRSTGLRDAAIILVLMDTGLRASELCALTVANYDQKRGRLHVLDGKGGKARYVVLGSRSQRAVWRYLARRDGVRPTDALFTSKLSRPIERNNLRHMLIAVGRSAGVEKVTVHRFRHTFAIQFLRNGGNLFVLKELLGHESLDMVMRYARVAEQDIDASVKHSPVDNWRL